MRLRKRRRGFVDLRPAELGVVAAGDERLFLGRFDLEALRRELAEAGILDGLARRGHADVGIRTGFESGEHRLTIRSRGGRVSLVDLRVAEAAALAEQPLRRCGLDILSFLSIHWVALQDPKGRFTAARPRLPGQRYPGLRLGRLLYARLILWATLWGKDGLLNTPEYFHNAVFYGSRRRPAGAEAPRPPLFQFVSSVRQGRFEALVRDLEMLRVAEASAAVEEGRVWEEPAGRVFRWEPGEMVSPITPALQLCLDAPETLNAVAAARDAVRFRVQERPRLPRRRLR